jgi:hypothetical protein
MIYHVLPGDAQLSDFRGASIAGEVIVCREALISGPLDSSDLEAFWNARANHILTGYGEDEIEYHEKVANELNRLTELTPEDEVNLWFEYELFCSANMWFCLSLLEPTEATVYRVEPIGLKEENRWSGFGGFTSDDMYAAFQLRSKLDVADIQLGAEMWRAYSSGDFSKLTSLASGASDCFPYVGEVAAAAAEQDLRPREVVKEITAHGESDFDKIFAEFRKRAGVYGYGDLQVQHLIDQLSS